MAGASINGELILNSIPSTNTETDNKLIDDVKMIVYQMTDINLYSDVEVLNGLSHINDLVRVLRKIYDYDLVPRLNEIPKRERARVGNYASRLCEDAIDDRNPRLLEEAMVIINLTYGADDESYYTLHYDLAILMYCANQLNTSLGSIVNSVSWAMVSEVKERVDDFLSRRPRATSLSQFNIEVTKKKW